MFVINQSDLTGSPTISRGCCKVNSAITYNYNSKAKMNLWSHDQTYVGSSAVHSTLKHY